MGLFRQLDVGWPEVTIDVDDESSPGRFDLDVGTEKISLIPGRGSVSGILSWSSRPARRAAEG